MTRLRTSSRVRTRNKNVSMSHGFKIYNPRLRKVSKKTFKTHIEASSNIRGNNYVIHTSEVNRQLKPTHPKKYSKSKFDVMREEKEKGYVI